MFSVLHVVICMGLCVSVSSLEAMKRTNSKENIVGGHEKKRRTQWDVDPRSRTPLHHAAQQGDVSKIEQYLKSQKKPVAVSTLSARDEEDSTPLFIAVKAGHHEAAAYLFNQGANPYERCTAENVSPFELAALDGNTGLMKVFLTDQQVPEFIKITQGTRTVFHLIAASHIAHNAKKTAIECLEENDITPPRGEKSGAHLAAWWVGDRDTAQYLAQKISQGRLNFDEQLHIKWDTCALDAVKTYCKASSHAGKPDHYAYVHMLSTCRSESILDHAFAYPEEILSAQDAQTRWYQLHMLWQLARSAGNDAVYRKIFTTPWHDTQASTRLVITELVRLAHDNNQTRLQELITWGVDIDTQDDQDGDTALHRVQSSDAAQLLIRYGAAHYIQNKRGKLSPFGALAAKIALQDQEIDLSSADLKSDDSNTDKQDTSKQEEQAAEEQEESETVEDTASEESHKDAKARWYSPCTLL